MRQRSYGPSHTSDLDRILAIPRRFIDLAKVEDLTLVFRKPGGTMTLRPIQSAALWAMEEVNGAFLPIGVGHGKTLIALLAPRVLLKKGETAVILCPAPLVEQYHRHIKEYGEHFEGIGDDTHIVSYSEIQDIRPEKHNALKRLKPELVVADEGHYLRNPRSARTKRTREHLASEIEPYFVVMSGSFSKDKIQDYAHLMLFALREGSPLPFGYYDLEAWGESINAGAEGPPGALGKLCEDAKHNHFSTRDRFRCRLVSCPGVVATEESALGTSLLITARRPAVPASVQQALKRLREAWEIGDTELTSVLDYARTVRLVSQGLYLRWNWPGGAVDSEWLQARSDWNREVYRLLRYRSRPGLDTPGLVSLAAANGTLETEHWPAWAAVKDRKKPPTVAVWIDDFIVRDAMKWFHQEGRGVVWYDTVEIGRRVAQELGVPLGDHKGHAPFSSDCLVLSEGVYGTGTDGLQAHHNRCLFTSVPNGAQFQQIISRLHRPGSVFDCVEAEVYQTTKEMEDVWRKTMEEAKYLEETTGEQQKIRIADKLGF